MSETEATFEANLEGKKTFLQVPTGTRYVSYLEYLEGKPSLYTCSLRVLKFFNWLVGQNLGSSFAKCQHDDWGPVLGGWLRNSACHAFNSS